MKEELINIGFTQNEVDIYLILLKKTSLTGQQIRKLTNIANSRVYSALDSLVSKGVVTYEILPKHKLFSAVSPEILKNIIEEKKKKIENIIPQLKSMQSKESKETKTAVYEGFAGFKNAFLKMINSCPENETINIIGFSNQAYKNSKLEMLLKSVNKISIEKKHKFKMILDNKNNNFVKDRKKEGITQIRFMPEGFMSPAAIDIFQDKVYIFIWDETPYAFMIQNKSVADGFRIYFEFLWKMAK